MTQKEKLLLIDGNSIAFRAFFATYRMVDKFVNDDGLHTNAIFGFNNMLDILLKDNQPTYALVAFDAGKTTFRTAMYDDYKGGRNKTPSELREQFPYLRELLLARGIKTYELPDYEADDIIGTMSLAGEKAGYDVVVVTGDRDLTQLTSDAVTVDVTVKGVKDIESYTPAYVEEKIGITPTQIIDMKGLMGDSSDNYPGVTKVGEKTALNLLKTYGSIEGIYENIDEMKKSKVKENLINEKEQAFLSKKLATIIRDAPVTIQLDDLKYDGPKMDQLTDLYQQFGFKTSLTKLEKTNPDVAELEKLPLELFSYTPLTIDNLGQAIQKLGNEPLTFYLEMLTDNYHIADIDGFVFGRPGFWFASNDVTLLLEPTVNKWLTHDVTKILTFDAKRTYVAAHRLNLNLENIDFDLLLASYLLNTNNNSNDLGDVAGLHDYHNLSTDIEVYGKGVKRAIPDDLEVFLQHLVQKAAAICSLQTKLVQELAVNDQLELYNTMEMPLAIVLAKMEIEGIKVNATTLQKMRIEFADTLNDLEKKIYNEAGEEFNIKSTQQLSVILFDKLKLPPSKKTKTGYSTAVDVLEGLRDQAPIVDYLLNYRQIAKIQSTYVDGLLKLILPDNKVHTRYIQTLTQTGRLSSVDPNLQNIPIRLDEGRKIRQAFEPSKPDWEIFSSDYSQIELRVLSHISNDKNMQATFKEDGDIHASTAMRIFGLNSPADVTSNMRRQAKAVNFGIVYGISDFGLSQNLGITRKQAKEFIDAYLEQYPGIQQYMHDSIEHAKEKGYVETLFKRRRYLPDIHAKNFNARSFAERTAMNTPIQGSAADIIKVAMINMARRLKTENLQARMLLQVHDELVFEAPSSEIPLLEEIVPQVMDSAVTLAIPLKVESAHGKTWYDAK